MRQPNPLTSRYQCEACSGYHNVADGPCPLCDSTDERQPMKHKHTPGPWQVGNQDREQSTFVTAADPNTHVALALDFNEYERDEEREANARLIAAAPDLFAFAQLFKVVADDPDRCRFTDGGNTRCITQLTLASLLDAANAAIASTQPK